MRKDGPMFLSLEIDRTFLAWLRPYNLASFAAPSSSSFMLGFNTVRGGEEVALDIEI